MGDMVECRVVKVVSSSSFNGFENWCSGVSEDGMCSDAEYG